MALQLLSRVFPVLFLIGIWCTAAVISPEDGSLNFLILGDWGGLPSSPYRTPTEKHIAAAMNRAAMERRTQFQIALGDNFYYSGVKDIHDPRFKHTFEEVFTGAAMQNPWYLIAGNHDHNGNVDAEIAYSQISKRWNFPSYYYKKTFQSPDGATMDLVLIDTIQLCGNIISDGHTEGPMGAENLNDAEQQWQWIEEALKASTANYLVVGGHYPVYSIAEHGSTPCLVKRLKPLLEQYQVTAYINGHDHNLQHIRTSLDYFTIGSANFVMHSQIHKHTIPDNSLQFYYAKISQHGGFAVASLSKDELSLTFVTGENTEVHKASMSPRS